jgi:hypothetical protein
MVFQHLGLCAQTHDGQGLEEGDFLVDLFLESVIRNHGAGQSPQAKVPKPRQGRLSHKTIPRGAS